MAGIKLKVVGKTIQEAMKSLTELGLRVRISSEGGKPNVLTRDYRLDRVNLEVRDGRVVRATIG